MRKATKHLTAQEFDVLRPLLKTTPDRISAARSMMVDGLTARDAAAQFGWARQSASDATNIVWAAYEAYQLTKEAEEDESILMPAGWGRVTLIAPLELIAKFRAELAGYRTELAQASPQGPATQPDAAQKDSAPREKFTGE